MVLLVASSQIGMGWGLPFVAVVFGTSFCPRDQCQQDQVNIQTRISKGEILIQQLIR